MSNRSKKFEKWAIDLQEQILLSHSVLDTIFHGMCEENRTLYFSSFAKDFSSNRTPSDTRLIVDPVEEVQILFDNLYKIITRPESDHISVDGLGSVFSRIIAFHSRFIPNDESTRFTVFRNTHLARIHAKTLDQLSKFLKTLHRPQALILSMPRVQNSLAVMLLDYHEPVEKTVLPSIYCLLTAFECDQTFYKTMIPHESTLKALFKITISYISCTANLLHAELGGNKPDSIVVHKTVDGNKDSSGGRKKPRLNVKNSVSKFNQKDLENCLHWLAAVMRVAGVHRLLPPVTIRELLQSVLSLPISECSVFEAIASIILGSPHMPLDCDMALICRLLRTQGLCNSDPDIRKSSIVIAREIDYLIRPRRVPTMTVKFESPMQIYETPSDQYTNPLEEKRLPDRQSLAKSEPIEKMPVVSLVSVDDLVSSNVIKEAIKAPVHSKPVPFETHYSTNHILIKNVPNSAESLRDDDLFNLDDDGSGSELPVIIDEGPDMEP